MATSDSELDAPPRVNGSAAVEEQQSTGALEPGSQPLSQVTLPSTEIGGSPIDPDASFKTEANDDRQAVTVIPSSLTPPPSTQVAPNEDAVSGRAFASSQRSALFSPPATILNAMRDQDVASSDYVPPAPRQVLEASADELRVMLQTCIAEHQKLKMEAAHHKLQFNLLSLRADEESKRAAVEHDMVRRQVDALRMAEHSRQARRELSSTSESLQSKYLQMKKRFEAVVEENENLHRRLKSAKKVIQQKDEETLSLSEQREMLLIRIRENREHFHMLCSPGGIFHGALTPKQSNTTPQQYRATPRATPRTLRREESDGREHGLSALLEAMNQSQDHHPNSNSNSNSINNNNNNSNMSNNNNSNNSAPTTPMIVARPVPRLVGRHQRNAQSMSSLPTTPLNRPGGEHGGLLPSVKLVAQTEPRLRSSQRRAVPSTPPSRVHTQRKSRESTISAEDTEELARQAVESVKAVQSLAAHAALQLVRSQEEGEEEEEEERGGDDMYGSQASQAATQMLRRHGGSLEEDMQGPAGKSAAMHAKLFPDKRKHNGEEYVRGSPNKRMRGDGGRVGLGIQYKK